MKINDLVKASGEWMNGSGPSSDIVISSRVRLARNLANCKFPLSANIEEKAEILKIISSAIERINTDKNLSIISLNDITPLERKFLVERHLISKEQEEESGQRAVAISKNESIAIMINEEDHLRLQSLQSGLQLDTTFAMLNTVDDKLSELLQFAYDDELGYLTACPTNVGTGLRASVMLHLPALAITRHLDKAFRAISKLNLAVRGLYGEGTEAHGDFYQISNQITIGRSEEDILGDLRVVIDQIVAYEKSARTNLLEKELIKIEDKIWRSLGILQNARIISSEEVMRHLSAVRLGLQIGMVKGINLTELNEIFIFSQPAHLQIMQGHELDAEHRDILRAKFVREKLKNGKN